jgi:hypothetical protein
LKDREVISGFNNIRGAIDVKIHSNSIPQFGGILNALSQILVVHPSAFGMCSQARKTGTDAEQQQYNLFH